MHLLISSMVLYKLKISSCLKPSLKFSLIDSCELDNSVCLLCFFQYSFLKMLRFYVVGKNDDVKK